MSSPQHRVRWLDVDIVVDDAAAEWGALVEVEALVRRAADAVAAHSEFSDEASAVACVALSSDAAVRDLNKRYRGKDKPTNVLSFPAAGDGASADGDAAALGDIILAYETLVREAEEQGISLAHHLQHLVVHGLLHLMGFDHETEAEAEDMESLEIDILAGLGIDNPYTQEVETLSP